MAAGLEKTRSVLSEQHAEGEPFYFRELPDDHPAREYAREVTGHDPGAEAGAVGERTRRSTSLSRMPI